MAAHEYTSHVFESSPGKEEIPQAHRTLKIILRDVCVLFTGLGRRLIAAPEAQDGASYRVKRADWKGSGVRTANVRFGSGTDILRTSANVRFVPESGH